MPSLSHGQDDPQNRPANQNLRHLRAAIHMAQKVGKSLGTGPLLLRPLPHEKALKRIAFHLIQIEGNPRQASRWSCCVSPLVG
jgi:hypothetical protein